MTTRLELCQAVRLLLPDQTRWPEASLNAWIGEAVRDYSAVFPLVDQANVPCHPGERRYPLSFPGQIIDILQVEFPLEQDPPRYLMRMPRSDPRFEQSPVYDFFVEGLPDAPVLMLGEVPAAGQGIGVTFTTRHPPPTSDDYVLTLPGHHLEALKLYVLWQALRQLELEEASAAAPTPGVSSLLGINAARAERLYRARLRDLRALAGPGGFSGTWNPYKGVY